MEIANTARGLNPLRVRRAVLDNGAIIASRYSQVKRVISIVMIGLSDFQLTPPNVI